MLELYADGENRTRKAYATRPSSVRVYQFHHIREVCIVWGLPILGS